MAARRLDVRFRLGECVLTMSNRALWNVRKRHEWLATPLKAKRVKRAQRLRCGLQDAMDRKAGTVETPEN
jgi:hypothetical protein